MQAEKDALPVKLAADVQSSAEEMEKLLFTVEYLTSERDQLKTDLQEKVRPVIQV